MNRKRHVHAAGLAALALVLIALSQGCGSRLADVDTDVFPRPHRDSVTFWGHACSYIDVGGFGIVTDPMFEKSFFVLRRRIPAPPRESYSDARVILLSHAHRDHLSPKSLATFPAEATILCPEPCAKHLKGLDLTVRVMRPGETFEIPGGRIIAVAADHPGGKYSINAEADGRALGYVIETSRATIYWSGDTRFFPGFDEIGRRYRPDLALLDINGHLHSTDVLRAVAALRAGKVIPLHYGAYGYFVFGERKKPRDHEELERWLGPIYRPLEIGESYPLPGSVTIP